MRSNANPEEEIVKCLQEGSARIKAANKKAFFDCVYAERFPSSENKEKCNQSLKQLELEKIAAMGTCKLPGFSRSS